MKSGNCIKFMTNGWGLKKKKFMQIESFIYAFQKKKYVLDFINHHNTIWLIMKIKKFMQNAWISSLHTTLHMHAIVVNYSSYALIQFILYTFYDTPRKHIFPSD